MLYYFWFKEHLNLNYDMLSSLQRHYTSDEISSDDSISSSWNTFFIKVRKKIHCQRTMLCFLYLSQDLSELFRSNCICKLFTNPSSLIPQDKYYVLCKLLILISNLFYEKSYPFAMWNQIFQNIENTLLWLKTFSFWTMMSRLQEFSWN